MLKIVSRVLVIIINIVVGLIMVDIIKVVIKNEIFFLDWK